MPIKSHKFFHAGTGVLRYSSHRKLRKDYIYMYKRPKYRMPYINDAHGMHATQKCSEASLKYLRVAWLFRRLNFVTLVPAQKV